MVSCYVVNIQGTGNYLLELSEDIELGPVSYKDDLLLVENWRPGERSPRDSCDSLTAYKDDLLLEDHWRLGGGHLGTA